MARVFLCNLIMKNWMEEEGIWRNGNPRITTQWSGGGTIRRSTCSQYLKVHEKKGTQWNGGGEKTAETVTPECQPHGLEEEE